VSHLPDDLIGNGLKKYDKCNKDILNARVCTFRPTLLGSLCFAGKLRRPQIKEVFLIFLFSFGCCCCCCCCYLCFLILVSVSLVVQTSTCLSKAQLHLQEDYAFIVDPGPRLTQQQACSQISYGTPHARLCCHHDNLQNFDCKPLKTTYIDT